MKLIKPTLLKYLPYVPARNENRSYLEIQWLYSCSQSATYPHKKGRRFWSNP